MLEKMENNSKNHKVIMDLIRGVKDLSNILVRGKMLTRPNRHLKEIKQDSINIELNCKVFIKLNGSPDEVKVCQKRCR